MAARSPARGCVEARIDPARSFVRLSWMTESVAVLIPWPVRAMAFVLALMRSVARIVRARRTPVSVVAPITTSSTTRLSRRWLPFRSKRHPLSRPPDQGALRNRDATRCDRLSGGTVAGFCDRRHTPDVWLEHLAALSIPWD